MKTQLHSSVAMVRIARALTRLLPPHAFPWAVLLALAALAFGPHPVQADVTEAWVQRFSNVLSNSVDVAVKVARDAAGDIIVTGTTDDGTFGRDMLTIKYSGLDGFVLWQQRYNGLGYGDDIAHALAVDGNGNVVLTGYSDSGTGADYYTAKYAAADGRLLWEKRSQGPYNGGDVGRAVAVDGVGNVLVTGRSHAGYYTAKYAALDGAVLWENRSIGPANDFYNQPFLLAVDGTGNVAVTGIAYGGTYTAKYAALDGALLWEKHYLDVAGKAVAVDGRGNVVVTGHSYVREDNVEFHTEFHTAKYAAVDGSLLWEKREGGGEGRAVAVDRNDNVVVTGASDSDYYTAKYAAADGAQLWEQRSSGPTDGSNYTHALALDASGNVVVTGRSFIFWGLETSDFYTTKYAAADGTLLWDKRHHSFVFSNAAAVAIVVDGSGNAIVTGTSSSTEGGALPGHYDYYTAKYAAGDGNLLWEQRYNGPVHHESHPNAVAMDRSGNVVVTATSENDFYTAKYAALDGALLWVKRGEGNSAQVVVDDSGNVVVTGYSPPTANGIGTDYYTAKYAANGVLLWERHYNGPANSVDGATALALDASGNVVVTGYSWNATNYDYYTAKYAASDGALLWEKRYNGPGNGPDQPTAVVVDGNGNVVVTGVSAISGSAERGFNFDYYTAKYGASDGALLWEKRSNGPARYDFSAVAVDSSGNVVVAGFSGMVKYASVDGALLWEISLGGGWVSALAVDGSGNALVTGTVGTRKYAAADGALLWEKRMNDRYYTAVSIDDKSDVVVTGTPSGDYVYTAKYASKDGALLWEKIYQEPGSHLNYAHGLALGPNGRVAITGSSRLGTNVPSDVLTVVYREGLSAISIELAPAGVRLRFTGTAGQSYSIQRAPAVTGPWTTINTQTAPASGLLEYLDTNPSVGAAFYRTREP